jgi:hypothetical protein
MVKTRCIVGGAVALIATVGHAGIPTKEMLTCPVDGTKFETVGSSSCSSSRGSQDFFMRLQTSCDFVTRLAQCPDNKLPLYKEFSETEIALLSEYIKGDEYQAMRDRSRFYIIKKIDDYLVSKGSTPTINFAYLLGGMQYDRESTQNDAEYRRWFIDAGEKEAASVDPHHSPFVRLMLAYTHSLNGQFDKSNELLANVKADEHVKDNKLAAAYVARLGECNAAKDLTKCPSTDIVQPQEKVENTNAT